MLGLPKVHANKDSLFTIQSLSVLDRVEYHKMSFKGAKLTNRHGNTTFLRLANSISLLPTNSNFKVAFTGNNKNDSLYKEIIDTTFKAKFVDTAIQKISFKNIQANGIYLIVSNALHHSEGGFPGPTGEQGGVSTTLLSLYEFFNVQNGKAINYTGISYQRGASFHRKNRNTSYKDVEKVFKRLYQISTAQDSLLKK